MIDYKELLRKYIQHVDNCEGCDFIEDCNTGTGHGGGFTEDEINELKELKPKYPDGTDLFK